MSQDGRRAERVKSLLRAEVIFNKGASTAACVVKNISPLGAKLVLAETVPSEFELYVPLRDRTYRGRIVWRDPEAVGVAFQDDIARAPDASGDSRIQELERQVAELTARVRTLTKRVAEID